MRQDLALPQGWDAATRVRELDVAHDEFVRSGSATCAVRPLVVDSWRRSLACGVDPERASVPIRWTQDDLEAARGDHPLTAVMHVVRRLLVEDAAEAGLVVAVTDAAGRILYVEGAPSLRRRAEAMNFVAGADWSEASAGTNAPGTALALGRPVQLLGPEHLSRDVTPWSCSAAPIRDPHTGEVLGVLDVTGGSEAASASSLGLVRATAAAAQAELAVARLSRATAGPSPWTGRPTTCLQVLGRHAATVLRRGTATTVRLRGSEILLALATTPTGMSAAELAVALSDDEHAQVTTRAEVSRLRASIAPLTIGSRPYRLGSPLPTDLDVVRRALHEGRLREAVALYPGPVLPLSTAPVVEALRTDLHASIRSHVVASHDAGTVLAFADTPHGRDDHAVWTRALQLLPPGSPRRDQAESTLARLDADLAGSPDVRPRSRARSATSGQRSRD